MEIYIILSYILYLPIDQWNSSPNIQYTDNIFYWHLSTSDYELQYRASLII